MIEYQCKCGKVLQIDDRYAGKTGKCNGCGAAILVPHATEAPQATAENTGDVSWDSHNTTGLNSIDVNPEAYTRNVGGGGVGIDEGHPRSGSSKSSLWAVYFAGMACFALWMVVPILFFLGLLLSLVGYLLLIRDVKNRVDDSSQFWMWAILGFFLYGIVMPIYLLSIRDNDEVKGNFGTIAAGTALGCGTLVITSFFATTLGVGLALEGMQDRPGGRNITTGTFFDSDAGTNTNLITLEKFNQIQSGMTYEQVVGILGSPGTLMSESQLAGYHTAMYSWENPGAFGGNMNAMFQNGELSTKSQFMLK